MGLARVGLGANLGDAAATIEAAIVSLRSLGTVVRRSGLYRSEPWGVRDQPPFVNAAVLLETTIPPRELLAELQRIERALGRTETYRWGPRVIDLDLLAYDDVRIDEPELTLPHARLGERAFALVPLAEIDSAYGPALLALPARDRAEVAPLDGVNAPPPCSAANEGPVVQWDDVALRVRDVATAAEASGLTRLTIVDGDLEIEVRRAAPHVAAPERAPAAALETDDAPSGNGVVHAGGDREATTLRSDVVGIVRLSRPAVVEGAVLADERELAYVESLGIRNPISSGGPGRVSRVFVTDGAPVEFGQPLFEIER